MKNSLNPASSDCAGQVATRTDAAPKIWCDLNRSSTSTMPRVCARAYATKSTYTGCLQFVGNLIPASPDRLVEALVQQGEPADQSNGGASQVGETEMPAVQFQVQCQRLALERVMDSLVTPLDLIPFQVDEHVSQAGGDSHEHWGQAEKDPQSRPQTTGHPAHQRENR